MHELASAEEDVDERMREIQRIAKSVEVRQRGERSGGRGSAEERSGAREERLAWARPPQPSR